MNTRFYNAKILVLDAENHFSIAEDELHVTGDTITYIGPGRKADPDTAETTVFDREIDARGNLLIPGFKNAHTHTPMTFLRSYADDLPLHEWLERQVFPNEAKLAGDDVYWLNILGIMEYLTSGITSNFDMYIQQKNSISATVDTGFRTVLTSGLNNFVDSPEILEEMYNYVNELSDRTSYLLGFHAEYTTGGPLLESVAKLAEKYHSPVWTHNAETKSEVEGCKERWGLTPTQLMERLGMFQYGGGGYHCIWMEDRDFEIFRDRKLTAVTNPSSNLKLACGGGIWTSALDAAETHDGKVIGVDVDQRSKIGERCLTSAMKGLPSAINNALDSYFSGNFSELGGTAQQLGLKDGDYIGLPTDSESWGFTTFTQDQYETVLAGIRDGSIEISSDTENQPEVGSHVTVDYIS